MRACLNLVALLLSYVAHLQQKDLGDKLFGFVHNKGSPVRLPRDDVIQAICFHVTQHVVKFDWKVGFTGTAIAILGDSRRIVATTRHDEFHFVGMIAIRRRQGMSRTFVFTWRSSRRRHGLSRKGGTMKVLLVMMVFWVRSNSLPFDSPRFCVKLESTLATVANRGTVEQQETKLINVTSAR